jgi:flagellar hook-associated protein FlgK
MITRRAQLNDKERDIKKAKEVSELLEKVNVILDRLEDIEKKISQLKPKGKKA